MSKYLLKVLFFLAFTCFSINANGQSISINSGAPVVPTIPTVNSGYTATSNWEGICFVIENTNPYPAVLDSVSSFIVNTGSVTTELWYSATNLSGNFTAINAANGWNQIATNTFNSVGGVMPNYNLFHSNINFAIPANTTYRFYLGASQFLR